MSGPYSTIIPDLTYVTIPAAAGLDADSALPWLIDVDVFEQAVANTNWDGLAASSIYLLNGAKNSSGAQNDSIAFDVVLAKGTWDIELMFSKFTSYGIYSVQLAGVEKGTVDSYNSPSLTHNNRETITGVSVAQTAKYRLALVMATRNAASSNYTGVVNHVQLRRTA